MSRTHISAFTAYDQTYPPFINISFDSFNRTVRIIMRGPAIFDKAKGYAICGDMTEMEMSRTDALTFLKEAVEKLENS